MAHHKRVKKKEFVVKPWVSSLPQPPVSVSCWGEHAAQDIAFYVDWHSRHPFCVTPRKLEPGEEKNELDVSGSHGSIYSNNNTCPGAY